MTENYQIKLLRIVSCLLWFMAGVIILTATLYHWPRKTVTYENLETDKLVYEIGGPIKTSAYIEVFFKGKTLYDVILECERGRYLLTNFEIPSTPMDRTLATREVGVIPIIPTPDNCKVVIMAVHDVEIGPFLTHSYIQEIKTNQLRVEDKL